MILLTKKKEFGILILLGAVCVFFCAASSREMQKLMPDKEIPPDCSSDKTGNQGVFRSLLLSNIILCTCAFYGIVDAVLDFLPFRNTLCSHYFSLSGNRFHFGI